MLRRSVYFFVIMVCSGFVAGCGKTATDADFSKVKLDMTEDEVTAILGQPTKAVTHPQQKLLRMLEWGDDSRVVLNSGKVDTVVLHEKKILEKPTAKSPE
jgi:hypothetical protein